MALAGLAQTWLAELRAERLSLGQPNPADSRYLLHAGRCQLAASFTACIADAQDAVASTASWSLRLRLRQTRATSCVYSTVQY